MQVDLKKIRPLGIVLILAFSALVFIMCLTANLGVPDRYMPVHDADYYASSAEHLAELAEEARTRVLTAFEGDILCEVDPDAGFISSKSFQGRELRALELPGLWNGSMSRWNTLFVEVPLETFNPVKVVLDLLRPAHQ